MPETLGEQQSSWPDFTVMIKVFFLVVAAPNKKHQLA